jgi:hypothetical protein
MKRAARSYFLGLRASARFGCATRLRDAGKNEEALKAAREALAILSHPSVVRSHPAEGSVLSCATVLVEELAKQLQTTGSSHRDIVDALSFIRAVGPSSDLAHWIPYLEQRATQYDEGAA